MEALYAILALIVVIGVIAASKSIKTVQQYEDGIIFRFGRVLPGVRGPGLTVIRPIGDKLVKVNKQIIAMGVPAQEGITRDNVSVRVDAVVYFRVVDPIKASINVFNYQNAISQRAQTSLRSIIGQSEMDELLAERDTVNRRLATIIDEGTEIPWGVKVESVEIKDVSLPEGMKRSMSRQAEAERERRARIITADGEFQASKRLAAAANVMARDPAALQLRLLQTVVEVAGERNSTLVMPIPVELLRFFDKFTPSNTGQGGGAPQAEADSQSMGDFSDAEIQNPVGPAAIGTAPDVPLDIPDVPAIPELSPEEKGEVGTGHHLREPGDGKAAAKPAPADADTPPDSP
jgi:regulator of protease activity HflC (stomatin/prohibitin superfamily)